MATTKKTSSPSAVIYTRVSTEEQVGNHSLSTQQKCCEEFCAREGFEVVASFSDEGESAKTANRTELQEMLAYVAANAKRQNITAVVVMRVDRFSRNVLVHEQVRLYLRASGVNLRSATEYIDETAVGQMMEGVLAVMAQFDNAVRSDRTKAGMTASLNAGNWVWRPPIGYAKGPAGGTTMVHDPESAPLIVRLFEAVAQEGASQSSALREVTSLGLRRADGSMVPLQAVGRILRNPLYAGRIVVAKFGVDTQGKFEPIVSPELFDAVQIALSGGRASKKRHRAGEAFPLKRVVKCGKCGERVTGSFSRGRSKHYGYYRCYQGACRGLKVGKDSLEEAFGTFLKALSVTSEAFELLDAVVVDLHADRVRADELAERHLRGQLDEIERKEARLFDLHFYERRIDDATFEVKSRALREERAEIETTSVTRLSVSGDPASTVRFARSVLGDLGGCWNRLTTTQRADFALALFPYGLVYDEGFVGTAESPWSNWPVGAFEAFDERVAPPTGFEPVRPP